MKDFLNAFSGIKVIQSPLCEMSVPNRKHKRRRNQSEAYHKRIQKKWLKRFGTKKEKFAFLINPTPLGLPGATMAVFHPAHMAILRNLT